MNENQSSYFILIKEIISLEITYETQKNVLKLICRGGHGAQ